MSTEVIRKMGVLLAADFIGVGVSEEPFVNVRRQVDSALSRNKGTQVVTRPDRLLVEFDQALYAVRCAFELQKIVSESNSAAGEHLSLRIGVDAGDDRAAQGALFIESATSAERLLRCAGPARS